MRILNQSIERLLRSLPAAVLTGWILMMSLLSPELPIRQREPRVRRPDTFLSMPILRPRAIQQILQQPSQTLPPQRVVKLEGLLLELEYQLWPRSSLSPRQKLKFPQPLRPQPLE